MHLTSADKKAARDGFKFLVLSPTGARKCYCTTLKEAKAEAGKSGKIVAMASMRYTTQNPSASMVGFQRNPSLTKTDKAVIRAFTEHRAASSKLLTSDGDTLSGNYMGGSGIARWSGDKIHLRETGGKTGDVVIRAVLKEAPRNWIAKNPTAHMVGFQRNPASVKLTKWHTPAGAPASIEVAYIERGKGGILGAARIIREGGSYHADRCEAVSGVWTPWETVDSHKHATKAAAKAAVSAWVKRHYATSKNPSASMVGFQRNPATLQEAVLAHAMDTKPLRVGSKVGKYTVTKVGDHTIQFSSKDGWDTSVQIPFVAPSGEMTPAWHRAMGGLQRNGKKKASKRQESLFDAEPSRSVSECGTILIGKRWHVPPPPARAVTSCAVKLAKHRWQLPLHAHVGYTKSRKRKNPPLAYGFSFGGEAKVPPKRDLGKASSWKVSDYLGWDDNWLEFDKPVNELTARTKADKVGRGGSYGGKDATRFTLKPADKPDWITASPPDPGLVAFQLEAKAHGKTLKEYLAALKAGFKPRYMSYEANDY